MLAVGEFSSIFFFHMRGLSLVVDEVRGKEHVSAERD